MFSVWSDKLLMERLSMWSMDSMNYLGKILPSWTERRWNGENKGRMTPGILYVSNGPIELIAQLWRCIVLQEKEKWLWGWLKGHQTCCYTQAKWLVSSPKAEKIKILPSQPGGQNIKPKSLLSGLKAYGIYSAGFQFALYL